MCSPARLCPIPDEVGDEDAAFLANMETAVSLLMDARPIVGERVVVLGQGIVGLLLTSLLARSNVARLVTVDRWPLRRQASTEVGADASLDPETDDIAEALTAALEPHPSRPGADLVFEVSGNPRSLQLALDVAGDHARIVLGSWYGSKSTEVNLGGRFHRSGIRLRSSQVSRLAPDLTGRWTKDRRLHVAWSQIETLRPARFVS